MRKKKMLFIYNPCAGKGAMKSKLSDVMETFMRADYEVTVYATQREREATELVMELGEKYDRIVCSGGDGTLHEVTQGLMNMPAESRPVCGYIPTGTVNDFARGLKLPTRVRNAAKTAVTDKIKPMDIGLMNGEVFTYVAAFGAFTSVSYETPQAFKNLLGRAAYIVEGMGQVGNIKAYPMTIETKNEKITDEFLVKGYYRNYDGMHLLKHALHNTCPDMMKSIGKDEHGNDIKVRDSEGIQLANAKIDEIRNGFSEWLEEQSPQFKERLTTMYNRKFNCFVRPKYDGSHQTFPDLNLKGLASRGIKSVYPSQMDCVWMLKQNGGGICDHEVLRP